MSRLTLFIKTLSVLLVSVSFVVILGCTTTPHGSEGTTHVISLPSAISSPVPAPTYQHNQSAGNIQLVGNIYGLSSDPSMGIDTITFSIGLTSQATVVDLRRMELVFSTPGRAPVILTQGTRESTSIFTTTKGGNAVNELYPRDEVDISFRVKPVSGGNRMNIEVRPPSGAALPISRIVPQLILSMNLL